MDIPWKSENPPLPSISWLSYNTFDECPRKWFYSYGLKPVPGNDDWDFIQQKALMPWGALTGRVVDDIITAALRKTRTTGRFPATLAAKAAPRVEEYLEYSRRWTAKVTSKETWPKSKHLQPLDRIFFGEDPSDEEVAAVIAKAESALQHFAASDFLADLIANPPDQWVFTRDNEVDVRPWFFDGEAPIWSSFDLIFRRGDRWFLVDWKTGDAEKSLEKTLEQLHWYAALMLIEWKIPPEQITLVAGNLSQPNRITPNPIALNRIEGIRRSWASRHRALVGKLQAQPPLIDQFPLTKHVHLCPGCQFRACPNYPRP